MSDFNTHANNDRYREVTRAWVRATCPLVYLFAPSNTGKTTLLGSLFPADPAAPHSVWTYRHDDYCKVLYIDADQGGTTIEHLVGNEQLCDYRRFNIASKEKLAWLYTQVAAAEDADCNAIVIEGATSVHTQLVADETRKNPGATGNTLRRCYIGASTHCKGMIDSFRQLKQNRVATGRGVPIFITLNTKSQPVDAEKPDSPERHVPDWSKNLVEQAMRGSDAHIQLVRKYGETRLITMRDEQLHPYCKMRSEAVAEAVASQANLNLPGLLTLWANTLAGKAKAVKKHLDSKQQPNHTETQG